MKHLYNRHSELERQAVKRHDPEAGLSAEDVRPDAAQTPLTEAEIQTAAAALGDRVTIRPDQLPNNPAIQAQARDLAGQNDVLARILIAAIEGGLSTFSGIENTDPENTGGNDTTGRPGESVDIGPIRPGVMGLLDSISIPESGGDYNIMVRGQTWPGGLTNATVGELCQTQAAKGRYQIVGPTMSGLIDYMGLSGNERFTPDLQDQMAVALLTRDCGLERFQAGQMSADDFRDRISRVWAGVAGSNGRGYYDGDQYGNQASHSIPDSVLESVRSDNTQYFA